MESISRGDQAFEVWLQVAACKSGIVRAARDAGKEGDYVPIPTVARKSQVTSTVLFLYLLFPLVYVGLANMLEFLSHNDLYLVVKGILQT